MIAFLKDHLLEIIGLIVAGGLTFGAVTFFKSKSVNKVTQKNNKAGGDIAGRDINK